MGKVKEDEWMEEKVITYIEAAQEERKALTDG